MGNRIVGVGVSGITDIAPWLPGSTSANIDIKANLEGVLGDGISRTDMGLTYVNGAIPLLG